MDKKTVIRLITAVLITLLVYTRFVNLTWGFPYPLHPDERNMADAITKLSCVSLKDCLNPHFFAYGQFSLYVGLIVAKILNFLKNSPPIVTFEQAVLSLRLISALASAATVAVGLLMIKQIRKRLDLVEYTVAALIFIFSPALIQFSHFGTTESLLMLEYSILVLVSIMLVRKAIAIRRFVFLAGLVSGIAIATKVSSLVFILLPVLVLIFQNKTPRTSRLIPVLILTLITLVTSFIFSPYNFLAYGEFHNSFQYESSVGLGTSIVFYTKQFMYSIPVIFEFVKIFPYALGVPAFVFFIFGLFFLPLKKEFTILRLAFVIYFIANAFIFAKWTRFMAPLFPVMIIITIASLFQIKDTLARKYIHSLNKHFITILTFIICLIVMIPGIAYISIYSASDVREQASLWIYRNIPSNSIILSEIGNVIDIPAPVGNITDNTYTVIPFDFYNLDDDFTLQQELINTVKQADYIVVPSRRLFANFTCFDGQASSVSSIAYERDRCNKLNQRYPVLNAYYKALFSGSLGYREVAKFEEFPTIKIGSRILFRFPDEFAEETWSVFDHPVIRIFKKAPPAGGA